LPFGGGNVEVKFLLLPEGEDPDSLVRSRGADDFRRRIPEALGLSTFLVRELSAQVDLGTSDGRAKLITLARPLLGRLPAGVYRELLVDELAELVKMSGERFKAVLDAPAATPTPAPPRGAAQNRSLIRKIITLIVHYPGAAGRLGPIDGLDSVEAPGAALLRRLLEMTAATPNLMGAQLIEAFRDDPEGRYLQRLAAEVPLDDETMAPAVLADSLKRLVAKHRQMAGAQALRSLGGRPPSQGPGGA
jgi:DNA primase